MTGVAPTKSPDRTTDAAIEIGLNAAIVSVRQYHPQILVVRASTDAAEDWDALPFGPFSPQDHRTFEIGLRRWVQQQTGLE
ncbi:MAG: NAD regulator, partial [Methyloligellaceae bacterium]